MKRQMIKTALCAATALLALNGFACLLAPILLLAGCGSEEVYVRQERQADQPEPEIQEKQVVVETKACYPEFSWDKLPLYIHIRKSNAFSKKELKYLASFPLITFEKFTGHGTYGSWDAGTREAAKAVKRINPKVRVLLYRNVFVHYGGFSFNAELDSMAAPYLMDKRGGGMLIRGRAEAYDLSKSKVSDWWVRSAAAACANDAIDGLFVDGNVKVLHPTLMRNRLRRGKKDKLIKGYREMMKKTVEALGPEKLMIANIIRESVPNSGLPELNAYFDGSYLEGFDGQADHIAKGIAAVQKAARSGKIIAMTLGLGASAAALDDRIDDVRKKVKDVSTLQNHIDFCIAVFLVCAEKYSYLYLHDGYSVNKLGRGKGYASKMWLKRLPEYDRPLGPPKGPAKHDGFIYTREFEHVSVRLDLETKKGEVTWKQSLGIEHVPLVSAAVDGFGPKPSRAANSPKFSLLTTHLLRRE
jgi:hypothetical protein